MVFRASLVPSQPSKSLIFNNVTTASGLSEGSDCLMIYIYIYMYMYVNKHIYIYIYTRIIFVLYSLISLIHFI